MSGQSTTRVSSHRIIVAALRNTAGYDIFALWFPLSSSSFFFLSFLA